MARTDLMLHPDGATVPPKSIAYLGHRHRRCFVCSLIMRSLTAQPQLAAPSQAKSQTLTPTHDWEHAVVSASFHGAKKPESKT